MDTARVASPQNLQDVGLREHISYCLSQLSFTEKGLKKLIELRKTYELILSEDSVMDHFNSILNKGKKFAKPELRVCLDEFEEEVSKIHLEKKEQEVTTRNARAHQENVAGYENFSANGRHEVEKGGRAWRDGEVVDSSIMEETPEIPHDSPVTADDLEESSGAFSGVTESELGGMENQSPTVSSGGEASITSAGRANSKMPLKQEEIPEHSEGEEEVDSD